MRFHGYWVAGLALSCIPGIVSAQVETQGTIVVVVADSQGSRLPGAIVAAAAPDTVTSREAVTNGLGEAMLPAMDPSARYTVSVHLDGFTTARHEAILVRSGNTATVRATLELAGITEEVLVTAVTPLVDTTSAIQGQDITLDLTESLPTLRSYQDYLQLVPGVLPSDQNFGGNPASKSGVNYTDRGDIGRSTDNFYYIDGINVTDGVEGTFGADLNTEIIQEQKVLTGGLPAEYVGAPGLLSNVVLKAGSNRFSGSVNYFFQNAELVARNEHSEDERFSAYDAAFTFGGPIVIDRAWFFASYRRLARDADVTALDTTELLRTVEGRQNQGYARGTWSPTSTDTLSFTWLSDPLTVPGSISRNVTNAWDETTEAGGHRYNVKYSRLFGSNALLDLAWNQHSGGNSHSSVVRESSNRVLFRLADEHTREDEQLGGRGQDNTDERDTELLRAALDYSLDRHDLKAGFEWKRNSNFRESIRLGNPPASWTSLAPHLAGTPTGDLQTGAFTGRVFDPSEPTGFGGLIAAINAHPERDKFYEAYDENRDDTITPDELERTMVFDSTEGNPNGAVNGHRTVRVTAGPLDTRSDGLSFYVQDTFSVGNLVVNAGMRTERWKHFATTGENIFTFPWTWAPRLSAVYDLMGDGRQKISSFWGRYFDPVRNNMTNFAGTLTGEGREQQVWAVDQWLTYRVRGGPTAPDAVFAPTTKTPFTDDFQLGYQIDLGDNMSFDATFTHRRTRDILEDYDLALYAYLPDGETTFYPGPIDHPDSLWLGLDYFGYTENPGSNYVIATLAGGERNYQGIEFVFRKRFTGRWQALVSYTYNDADGNTSSDSHANVQGDFIWLDPRAPNAFGTQPGLIRHLFKLAATYQFDFGLELGARFGANSGVIVHRSFGGGIRAPSPGRFVGEEPFEFAGITRDWISPGSVGQFDNPSWALLDLRVQYLAELGRGLRGEFFVDIFNVFDSQSVRRLEDRVNGGGGSIGFMDPIEWNNPRRFFLGARLSF